MSKILFSLLYVCLYIYTCIKIHVCMQLYMYYNINRQLYIIDFVIYFIKLCILYICMCVLKNERITTHKKPKTFWQKNHGLSTLKSQASL